ncbi:scavenger receptor cysteine-rich type 1 protein M130-like [Apus apus]|uniref:scavenger receptor cysteine-rich type 1 protein M130-like n=1 Tax=Apus apus TaxID=8895 RepID=UPI0021F8A750|nr:scavenger receptor cysteine-rich type 1 protein M130-like [Apus apus]
MVPVRELGLLLCLQLCGGTEELRLVGGGGRCAGRVEVKHEGQWGSVCKNDVLPDTGWATLVCMKLGCGPVARTSVYAPFGQGTGRIWLHLKYCLGKEEALQECPHYGWGEHFCGHDRDIGVTCAEAVELRLAAGRGPCDGRVEVKLQGRWGSVGDKPWTMEDAEVVCKQLGCGSAVGAHPARNTYGEGDGPISLAAVECRGDEAALWDCEVRGWGPYKGPHDYDTSVVCQGFSRLVGGDGACAGRLEVWQGQSWASVCQDEVDMEAARVVCQELGCGAALAVPLWSEEGAGPLWQGGFNCSGHESLLSSCARGPPRSQGCAGHAGIVCSPYTGFRLANGSSGCAGRVEVEAGGTWGSLCASGWDLRDAHVLCQHLGCGPASAVPPAGSFGGGNGTVWRDTFRCQGNERHPGECLTAALGEPACPPGHAAAVSCSALEGVEKPLRLVEGQSRCDGRLEAATGSGAWARVAEGPRDAGPVCQQLGCGELEKVQAVAGSGSAALRCGSSRDSPALCNVSASQEVAVVCSGECPGQGQGCWPPEWPLQPGALGVPQAAGG